MKKYSCNKTLFKLFSLFLFFSLTKLCAQRDSDFALYKYHMNIINPAFIGTQGGVFLNTSIRRQWTSLNDGPQIRAVSLGIPSIKNKLNFRFFVLDEKTFIEQSTRFYNNFSYSLKINEDADLYLGLNVGVDNFGANFSALKNMETNGDIKLENYSRFSTNVGVGFYFKHKNYFIALSVPKLFQTKIFKDYEGISFSNRDRIYLYTVGGLKFPIEKDWFLTTSTLLRYVKNNPWNVINNIGVLYKNIEFNFGYQWKVGFSNSMMLEIDKFISFGYSYQYPKNVAIAPVTGGSHEILLKIRLGKPRTPVKEKTENIPEKPIIKN